MLLIHCSVQYDSGEVFTAIPHIGLSAADGGPDNDGTRPE